METENKVIINEEFYNTIIRQFELLFDDYSDVMEFIVDLMENYVNVEERIGEITKSMPQFFIVFVRNMYSKMGIHYSYLKESGDNVNNILDFLGL